MAYEVLSSYGSTEAEAIAEIEAAGWYALTLTFPPEELDWHWHDFDQVVYVLEGRATIEFVDGAVFEEGPGARVSFSREVVHREKSVGYRAVVGLSADPATLTEINKPLPVPV